MPLKPRVRAVNAVRWGITGTAESLITAFDYVWERFTGRLTDEEYLGEPVPGCWTLRQRLDGSW